MRLDSAAIFYVGRDETELIMFRRDNEPPTYHIGAH